MADPLSPSGRACGLTHGQVTQLTETVELSLLSSPEFLRVPTVELGEFIKIAGLELVEVYIELAERMLQTFVDDHILVDYGLENAIDIALDSFALKDIYIDRDKIPLLGEGGVLEKVHEVPFGKVILNDDLLAALKAEGIKQGFQFGLKPCNPLTALLFALKFPTKQLQNQLGISFYDKDGRLCYLSLYQRNGEPRLRVGLAERMAWRKGVVLLCVAETEPVTA